MNYVSFYDPFKSYKGKKPEKIVSNADQGNHFDNTCKKFS